MPTRNLDAVFFVDATPEFEYRDGLFHVTYEVGAMRVERVMRPAVFFESIAQAVAISRQHRGWKGGEVVSLADHAAAASGSPSK